MCGAPCVPSKSLVRQLKILRCTERTYSRYTEHVCFFSQKHRLPSWLKVSKDFPGSPASPRLQHVPKNKHGRQQHPIQLLSFQASLFPLHPLCTSSAGVYWRFFLFLSTSKLSCCMVCSSPLWNKIRVANRIKEFIEKNKHCLVSLQSIHSILIMQGIKSQNQCKFVILTNLSKTFSLQLKAHCGFFPPLVRPHKGFLISMKILKGFT